MKSIFQLILLISLCSCSTKNTSKVTVATAANMQFAMTELIKSFKAETGISCEMIVSSSGKLTAQIKEGAPYDIFVSADLKYPEN
ncbi:MAG: substrate-binding domain-containing protein, partial [Leeuwenhoekiella sp.]